MYRCLYALLFASFVLTPLKPLCADICAVIWAYNALNQPKEFCCSAGNYQDALACAEAKAIQEGYYKIKQEMCDEFCMEPACQIIPTPLKFSTRPTPPINWIVEVTIQCPDGIPLRVQRPGATYREALCEAVKQACKRSCEQGCSRCYSVRIVKKPCPPVCPPCPQPCPQPCPPKKCFRIFR